jgi:hypothetical protein
MGWYINPNGETKESFLKREGRKVTDLDWNKIPKGQVPVVLIDNGFFTGAGIAYSQRELQAFTQADDPRPKTFYLVPTEKILEVMGNDEDFLQILKENGLA